MGLAGVFFLFSQVLECGMLMLFSGLELGCIYDF
jgi:hypothetical protein